MFDPSDKAIYEYHDGVAPRKEDPLAIQYAIMDASEPYGGDFGGLWRRLAVLQGKARMLGDDAKEDDPASVAAANAALKDLFGMTLEAAVVVRKAFGVPEPKDGGWPAARCLAEFRAFREWMAVEKKADAPSPTCAPAAGAASSAA